MQKKKVATGLLALPMALSLAGCGYVSTTTTVEVDGSVTTTGFLGFSAEAWAAMDEMDTAETFGVSAVKGVEYDGVTYIGDDIPAQTYTSVGEFSADSDGLFITSDEHSYTMTFTINDPTTYMNFENMEGFDLEMEGLDRVEFVYLLNYEFPYPVRQISGPTDGVTVNGYTVTLNQNLQAGTYTFYSERIFTDVPENAWYTPAVLFMQNLGIVEGYGDGTFRPEDTLTTAQLCKVLATADPSYDAPLTTSTHWAASYAQYCLNAGYIDTLPENWDTPITREYAVSALTRMYMAVHDISYVEGLALNVPDAADCSSDRFKNDIAMAYYFGIVTGSDEQGTFRFTDTLTRAQLCQMFYNFNYGGDNNETV